ncbi:hypothetical protein GCM10011611_58910 [Aliidongia dinghuensis]|uniref:Secreted protein n=1 Tax=Aliidongia dinghuensis TaxID=1867774 RepID=A0A8J3E6H7_9PROT|nr:hypothetical protein [Aliidongia dinghuensis]GGF44713.1 hypothetical protein GCM10011611_58910 [Aliidongia dinghuensis]
MTFLTVPRGGLRFALSLAALAAIALSAPVAAHADDDDQGWHEHHDHGWHRGWYKHHDDDDDGPRVYYAPAPVYVAPPPPVVVAPAPVYVAPPPAALNVVVPLHFH